MFPFTRVPFWGYPIVLLLASDSHRRKVESALDDADSTGVTQHILRRAAGPAAKGASRGFPFGFPQKPHGVCLQRGSQFWHALFWFPLVALGLVGVSLNAGLNITCGPVVFEVPLGVLFPVQWRLECSFDCSFD